MTLLPITVFATLVNIEDAIRTENNETLDLMLVLFQLCAVWKASWDS